MDSEQQFTIMETEKWESKETTNATTTKEAKGDRKFTRTLLNKDKVNHQVSEG